MPVFEILERGLYHEKNGIYACQNVVETCRKHGDMILCYLLVFLFFNLIKTAAKFMQTESVKCPARAVFAKSSLNVFYCQIYTATGLGHKFSQHYLRPFPYRKVESQARANYITQFTNKS